MIRKRKHHALSIRGRYLLTMGVFLAATLAAIILIGIRSYRASWEEQMEAARNDFETAWRDLNTFTNRVAGLSNMVQYNSSLVELLMAVEDYTVEEYQLARLDLIPMIYSLEDGSGEYTCRLYIRSTLPFLDLTSHVLMLRDVEDTSWAHAVMDGFGQSQWVTAERIQGDCPAYLVPIRNLNRKTEQVAILRIDVSLEAFLSRMNLVRSSGYVRCELRTETGEPIAFAGQAETEIRGGLDDLSLQSYEWNTLQQENATIFYRRLDKSGWLLSMTVPWAQVGAPLMQRLLTLMGGAGLLVIAGMLLAGLILWNAINRIELFHRHVQAYNARSGPVEELPASMDPGADDEVGQLIEAHNGMVERVGRLMREQEAQKEESRRLEINALQNQINPHFLYNTLDALNWMAKMDQPEQVETLIRNLSDFYRLCLSGGAEYLTVEKELEICRHYFRIMVLRSHRGDWLDISVPKEILERTLPKITLQPLVENAIVHGLMESGQTNGFVRIRGRVEENRQILSVEDSGGRLTRAVWEGIMSGSIQAEKQSYGLKNVERRLCLFLGRNEVLHLRDDIPGLTVLEFEL